MHECGTCVYKCPWISTCIFVASFESNMTHKRKSVSDVGFATVSRNGFRARIYVNKKYTSGPTRPTIELAYADLNAARTGATSYEDVAALLKQLSSSPMAARCHYRQQGPLSKTVSFWKRTSEWKQMACTGDRKQTANVWAITAYKKS